MSTIKSWNSSNQLAIDANQAARVILYDAAGNVIASQIRGTAINLNTSGGTDARDGVAILGPGPSGGVVLGTTDNPLRTNPTGTTAQPVNGTVQVGNFPTTQPVSGTLTVNGSVAVSNQPSALMVSNFPATQQVAGSVAVTNFPGTQQVAGNVNVANLPSTQNVQGTVQVGNFPATQQVGGTVSINSTTPISVAPQDPDIGMSYAIAIDIVPSTVTASTVYFSLRNSGSKTIYVARFDLQQGFTGTAAASRSSFEFIRYSGTPTGGTAITPAKKISGNAASTATVLTAAAGLTVTGVTFDAMAFHRQTSANQLAATSTQDVTFADNDASKFQLLPGEGIAIRANGAVLAGSFLTGSVGWHEK